MWRGKFAACVMRVRLVAWDFYRMWWGKFENRLMYTYVRDRAKLLAL